MVEEVGTRTVELRASYKKALELEQHARIPWAVDFTLSISPRARARARAPVMHPTN